MKLQFKNIQLIPVARIDKLEADFKIKLPEDYKQFLFYNHGGRIEDNYCFTRKMEESLQEIAIENFLTIDEIYSFDDNLKDCDGYLDLLPIASSLGSPVICIGINTTSNFGQIFILDWDFGQTFQNRTFNDFLVSLKNC